MKQLLFLLAAVALSGCQPAPIIINNQDDCHDHRRPPIIIERERPPVIIQQQQPPPVIIQQRPPVIINGCNQHSHCGNCPICRSNGWVSGIGIHIEKGKVGIGIGIQGHHHD